MADIKNIKYSGNISRTYRTELPRVENIT